MFSYPPATGAHNVIVHTCVPQGTECCMQDQLSGNQGTRIDMVLLAHALHTAHPCAQSYAKVEPSAYSNHYVYALHTVDDTSPAP
jgi:hypothetical protein